VGMAVAMGSDTAGVVEGVGTEVGVGAGVAWGVTDGATGGGVGVAAGVEAGNESGSGVGVGRVVGATVIEVGVGFVGVADGLTGVGVEVAGTAVLEGIVTGAGAVAVALCVSGFSGAWGGGCCCHAFWGGFTRCDWERWRGSHDYGQVDHDRR
jgi:hypothetical protein